MFVKDYSNGSVAAGTAATVSSLIGGIFNTALPTLTTGQQVAIQLDSSGRIIIALPTGSATAANQTTEIASLQLIDNPVGSVAAGAAGTSSYLIGGVFNTALPTLTNGQQAALQLDSSGRVIISSTAPIVVGSVDEATFTYGTSIDQIIGGVFQDTTPTLTTGQSGAVRVTANRGFHTNLRNSSGVEITSVSNGVAGDQLLTIQTPDTTTSTTALGALNASVSITMAGLSSCGFQILAGTLIGTVVPECSLDGGATWVSCSFYNTANSSVTTSLVFGSSNTLQVLSVLPIGGASNVRVRVSAYTSGTANSILRASMVTAAAGAVTAAAFGNVVNTYVSLTANTTTQLLTANTNRKYAYISNNSGGTIAIQFGSATGLTSAARGLVIPNSNFYELKGDNLYTGAVFAYTNASGLVIAVTEGTP